MEQSTLPTIDAFVHENGYESFLWPGQYEEAILKLVRAFPPVDKLLAAVNTPFPSKKGILLQGKSARIYGGALRWIVENVDVGNNPDEFLCSGSDIDISVEDFPRCCDRLWTYFRDQIAAGAIVEYVGGSYAGLALPPDQERVGRTIVDFAAKNKMYPAYGHYILYWRTSTTIWLKIDIIYDKTISTRTDFTVNSLRYPCGRIAPVDEKSTSEVSSAVCDIRNRLLVSGGINPKTLYRALRLPKYRMMTADGCDILVRRMHDELGCAPVHTLLGTEAPSRGDGTAPPTNILVTAHKWCTITREYVESMPGFNKWDSMNFPTCGDVPRYALGYVCVPESNKTKLNSSSVLLEYSGNELVYIRTYTGAVIYDRVGGLRVSELKVTAPYYRNAVYYDSSGTSKITVPMLSSNEAELIRSETAWYI
jgi:hypothetical protein